MRSSYGIEICESMVSYLGFKLLGDNEQLL